jgi:hypothetical protein
VEPETRNDNPGLAECSVEDSITKIEARLDELVK